MYVLVQSGVLSFLAVDMTVWLKCGSSVVQSGVLPQVIMFWLSLMALDVSFS